MKRALQVSTILVLAVIVLGILTSCGDKGVEQFKDAPLAQRNEAPADVVDMPDGYANLATKCDHGNRLYVGTHTDTMAAPAAVVPQDPTCPK